MFNERAIISKWIADMYDHDLTDISDVEFALSVIGKKPKRILEIACGSGRILVPLAKAEHIVTGLDFDECMLSKISAKINGMKNITWRKSDVINDDWGIGYDVVMLAANFLFNIISDMDYDKAQALVIQKSADALVSGGHIYIDYGYTLHPETWFGNSTEHVVWQGTDSKENTGKMVLLNSTFDKETGLNKFVRRFELALADGSIIKQDIPSVKHFATLDQIYNWLHLSGFDVEEEYGDYARNPISEKTNRAIIWARKK
ncbi:MAG: class I SAM-dependent methyltransferase [Clostridiaceae bacterium]|nr:class I SAM-dependent methyltransferase [Clostridiaceae bacterium]